MRASPAVRVKLKKKIFSHVYLIRAFVRKYLAFVSSEYTTRLTWYRKFYSIKIHWIKFLTWHFQVYIRKKTLTTISKKKKLVSFQLHNLLTLTDISINTKKIVIIFIITSPEKNIRTNIVKFIKYINIPNALKTFTITASF